LVARPDYIAKVQYLERIALVEINSDDDESIFKSCDPNDVHSHAASGDEDHIFQDASNNFELVDHVSTD
jgi:hypothetical protein